MPRETFDVEWPDGEYLGRSSDRDGSFRGLSFDPETGLSSQAKLFPHADDTSDSEPGQGGVSPAASGLLVAAALAVGALVAYGAIKAAPHVKKWWGESAAPWIKSTWRMITGSEEPTGGELAAADPLVQADFVGEVGSAVAELDTPMSSIEAQQRVATVLLAAAIIAENLRALSTARIEDPQQFPELAEAMRKLSTERVADSINRMLESERPELDESTTAALYSAFGAGHDESGVFIPLTHERIRRELRLIEGDEPDSGGVIAAA